MPLQTIQRVPFDNASVEQIIKLGKRRPKRVVTLDAELRHQLRMGIALLERESLKRPKFKEGYVICIDGKITATIHRVFSHTVRLRVGEKVFDVSPYLLAGHFMYGGGV